ncbi:YihY/virulence factor BrkB family protein [Streptomyces sp. MST-110588]|uniref:YihY/virulence factor BrkB family protein n=1 Tax=Streptomyces sp. MST-110588 TaxID=2833628 RepID=UPI001F5C2DB5|nr:YihY/virulence factor BrkB family protein [Streptomyces sp. MST-110588]
MKDTVNSCMENRVTGLAAEAAFFCLLSLPPLLLGLIGLLGYMEPWIGQDTIDSIRRNILDASDAVLSSKGVDEIARPLLDDIFTGRRPDVISLGFAIALWSGSRALNVFVDTITIMYGLDGRRGIVRTRLLAFVLYLAALVVGAVALPLMVVGPDTVVSWLPASEDVIRVLYWPVVLILSVAFLTTLYHVSVPVRSPWREDVPGAVVALAMWLLGSFLLRIYLTQTVEGPTVYGSLAAPVAVLLWIGVSAFAVLIGAAMNAAIDRVWPSVATAAGRAEKERRARAEAEARRADGGGNGEHTGAARPARTRTRRTRTRRRTRTTAGAVTRTVTRRPNTPSAGRTSCRRRTYGPGCTPPCAADAERAVGRSAPVVRGPSWWRGRPSAGHPPCR